VRQFVDHVQRSPPQQMDLTAGISCVLLGCALLLQSIPESQSLVDRAPLQALGSNLMTELGGRLGNMPPIVEAYDTPFLGIAHGWAGFLYSVLAWCQASGCSVPPFVRSRLEELVACGALVGRGIRWPRKVRSS